ncbi:uncharacterized protein At1g76070-like [Bidens hawaiensis]|uniref:uncharacterized protein At1g76070-like n=1 Tax=Bidens hawaiensis TaxID=980011 RepID=UPI00404A8B36
MEHQKTKSMSKILKFLPRATSSVSFQNPPLYSPVKDKKLPDKTHKSNLGIGFSGPLVSIVPPETRRKIKNDSKFTPLYEPTSPRVSCMGQVKCKHYRKLTGVDKPKPNNNNKFSRTTSCAPVRINNISNINNEEVDKEKVVMTKKKLGLRGLFNSNGRKSDASNDKSKTTALTIPKSQSLSTMKRFSSGRDAFINFDWTTQVAPLDSACQSGLTDDERDGGSDGGEVVIPSSAPVMVRNKGVWDGFVRVGGVNVEPRKEINLWKRRTMAQPQPLQLLGVN